MTDWRTDPLGAGYVTLVRVLKAVLVLGLVALVLYAAGVRL